MHQAQCLFVILLLIGIASLSVTAMGLNRHSNIEHKLPLEDAPFRAPDFLS